MTTPSQPASADEATRPSDHGTPGSLPWEAAARELARHALLPATEKAAPGFVHATAAETIRRACEQWAAIAHASWSKHLADYRAHHLAETCRLQAMLSERTAQLAQARAVIEECRPMVKARICMPPAGVDESVLGRIEQALSGAPAADTGGKEATL